MEENNKGIKSDDDGITEIGEEKNKWRSRKTLEDERKKKENEAEMKLMTTMIRQKTRR